MSMFMKSEEQYWFEFLTVMRDLKQEAYRSSRSNKPQHMADEDILEKLEDSGAIRLTRHPQGLQMYEFEIVNPQFDELYNHLEDRFDDKELSFDEATVTLTYGKKTLKLRADSLECALCKVVFRHPPRKVLNTDEVYEDMTGNEWQGKADAKRLSDALGRVNDKVQSSLNIEGLLVAENHTLYRSY